MKKLYILLMAASFSACQSEQKASSNADTTAAEAADQLSFKYDSVKVYSKHPIAGTENLKDTTKAVISYPVFADQKVNQFIEQKVMNSANEGEHYSSYEDFATAFVKNFDDFSKDNAAYAQTWFMNGKVEVIAQQPDYLSLLYTYVNYEGGAHPNSAFTYLNYNPTNHQEILLDSLIKPGSMPALTAIAEKIFRKNEKISATASLKDSYFFENDKFSLNQNFTIAREGLKFLYNPYEIKAYAFGTTELLVPFAALKEVARPNSLLNPEN
ncbi:DUF3298 and DUF4163 domain-containing protein [Pedobacter heparinus]|uniref:DUF3298 and DUF4163 domain-containing protein n=1 Tax=Pedobacter heparinus TaxID=984 RepID=UPI002930B2AE|nr:DUF3298 domain-containing protein [Pedobacter heparinus]